MENRVKNGVNVRSWVYIGLAFGLMVFWWMWLNKPLTLSDKYGVFTPVPGGIDFTTLMTDAPTPAPASFGLFITPTPANVLSLVNDDLPVTLIVNPTSSPAPTRTAFWATDYVTRSVLLTKEALRDPVTLMPTAAPYTWIATSQPMKIIVVTSPPDVYTTEVFVDVPYPIIQTVVVSASPLPTSSPVLESTSTATASPSPVPSATATAESTPEATFEVTSQVDTPSL